ncbi:MAG TPA: 4Fe-4S binding protein [Planctomycetota bacterium]|jgi:NAD-dependent dihydropyrimidine dehydrogenase PreA subunit
MYVITIDTENCVGCNKCVDACPNTVLEMQEEKCVATKADDCVGCNSCVEACDVEAIEVEEK